MDLDKEKNSKNEYERRHSDWRNISITQLSNVNNILLTLSSSFLVFVFDKNPAGSFYFTIKNIDWPRTIYFFAIIFLLLSIKSGIIVLFSRLYDLKISRNLALTRKRFLVKHHDYINKKSKRQKPNFCKEIKILRLAVCEKIKLIDYYDVEILTKEKLEIRFYNLSIKAKLLGFVSWRWLKYQIVFFLLNCVLYTIFRFVQ